MVMNRVKSLTTGRSLLAAVAIVSGLVVGTGQLTAASTQLEVGPASGGVDSMRVVGPGVEAGFKSLAMGLILQDNSRTLTDRDVDTVVADAVAALAREHDARIRG